MKTMMRTWSLVMALVFFGALAAPAAFAQGAEAEEKDDFGESKDEGGGADSGGKKDSGEKKDSAEKKDDMWDAPKTGTGEATKEEGEPEVVIPSGYPAAELGRPLALPPMTLEPELSYRLDFLDDRDNWFSQRVGAGFGIIDGLEAGLHFPLLFAPDVEAGDMQLYGLYDLSSLLGGGFKLAGRLRMIVALADRYRAFWGDFGMLAEALAKFELNDMIGFTGRAGLGFFAGELGGVDYSAFLLQFEGGVIFQAMDALALHLRFGLDVRAGDVDETMLPLMFRVQYTLIHDLDLWIDSGFVDLTDVADPWIMTLIIGANYRIGF